MPRYLLLLLACCACAPNAIETRNYQHLGNLKQVLIYSDPGALSDECVRRSGGVNDRGEPMRAARACSDVRGGVVRIAANATLRDFLHELCHIEDELARALCERLFP